MTARPEYVYLALFASEHWEECFVHLILRYSKTCQRSYSIVTDRIELYLTTLTTSTEAAFQVGARYTEFCARSGIFLCLVPGGTN